MKNCNVRILARIVILILLSTVFACSNGYSETKIPAACISYLYHESDQLDNSISFLRGKLKLSQKYLALKTISSSSYDLIVLSIEPSSAVFLATSFDRNVSVSLKRDDAVELYDSILNLTGKYDTEHFLKMECAFTRSSDNGIQDAVLLNPSNIASTKSSRELNIYLGLNQLLDKYFPSFRTYTLEELAGDKEIKYFEQDGFVVPEIELELIDNADEQKNRAFLRAIEKDLFFEMKM